MIAFAPVTVHTVLFVDPDSDVPADIPVKFDPSMAGKAPVSCADGKLVKDAPEPAKDVAVTTPAMLKLFKTKVAALLIVTDVPLPIGDILSTLRMLIILFNYLSE